MNYHSMFSLNFVLMCFFVHCLRNSTVDRHAADPQ